MKAIFEGRATVALREHNERAWLAWHIVALGKMGKKFPKLQKLLVKKSSAPRRRQTWQEQMAVMDMWAAVMNKIEATKTKGGG